MKEILINQELVETILKREIPLLFTEKAHKEFDFENMEIVFFNDDGEEDFSIEEMKVVIKNVRQPTNKI